MMQKIKTKLKEDIWNNITKFYLYRAIFTFMFFVPVYVLFLQERGFSMTEIMLAEALYAATIIVIKIPCGAFADIYGRKRAITLSSALLCIAVVYTTMINNIIHLFIAQLFWAFGEAMWKGVNNAFVYDSLKEKGQEKKYIRIESNILTIEMIGLALSSSIAGLIAKQGLKFNFYWSMPFLIIGLIISTAFKEPKTYTKQEKNHFQHIKESLNYTRKHKRLRFFIVYAIILSGMCRIMWAFYQPYFTLIGIDVKYIGIIYALTFITTAIGGRLSERIEKKLGEKLTLATIAFSAGICALSAGLIIDYYAFVFILALALVQGASHPLIISYINDHVQSSQRATIMSLTCLGELLLFTMISPIFGRITDMYSARILFIAAGILLLIDAMIIVIIFLYNDKHKKIE